MWDVTFLPNGDLVTACADYAARIWTASPDRAAPAESMEVSIYAQYLVCRCLAGGNSSCQMVPHSRFSSCVASCNTIVDIRCVHMLEDADAKIIVQAYTAAITERKAASAAAASGSGGDGGLPEGLKLEPEMALLVPGKKAGEMKVIQEGGGGVVYTWDDVK